MLFDYRFYLECAKFTFSLVAGATAGYAVIKGASAVVENVAALAKMRLADRMLNTASTVEDATTDDVEV